jgi:hypothetical protein
VSVSLPVASDPAETLMVAPPLLRVAAADVYVPLVSVTEPVGVGFPVPPLTATATVSACAVVMLDADGVTVNVGVVFAAAVTVTEFDPVALL